MDYKKYKSSIYVRLDKGDEVLSCISNICMKEKIFTASVSGIGGCGEIVVGTYEIDRQDYLLQKKEGFFEMLSINGNVTIGCDNNVFTHAHAIFSYIDENKNIKLIGGHLKKALISLTGEIVINFEEGIIRREKDFDTGLNVWKF